MSNERSNQQNNRENASTRERDRAVAPQPAGDNRRAGDTDGNTAGGGSKSKGAANPADERPEDDGGR